MVINFFFEGLGYPILWLDLVGGTVLQLWKFLVPPVGPISEPFGMKSECCLKVVRFDFMGIAWGGGGPEKK